MKRTVTISFLAAIALGAAIAAWAQAPRDPFVGTWKQDMTISKYDPPSLAPKTGSTIKREASGAGYKNIIDSFNAQGVPTHFEYTVATLDGKDYPVTGSPEYDSAFWKRIDATTLIYVNKKGGAIVRMGRITMAKDGRISTSDFVGYNAQGVAFHNTLTWRKQ